MSAFNMFCAISKYLPVHLEFNNKGQTVRDTAIAVDLMQVISVYNKLEANIF